MQHRNAAKAYLLGQMPAHAVRRAVEIGMAGVQSDAAMRTAMTEAAALDCIIAAHCEVNELLRGG